MTGLICVDPAQVPNIWPRVAPLIQRAMDKVGFSPFWGIEAELYRGASLLWIAVKDKDILAAMVTQITNDVCTIVALGGRDRDLWLDHIGKVEEYARANGCARMRIIGRKGWARLLPYQQACVVLERNLQDGR